MTGLSIGISGVQAGSRLSGTEIVFFAVSTFECLCTKACMVSANAPEGFSRWGCCYCRCIASMALEYKATARD